MAALLLVMAAALQTLAPTALAQPTLTEADPADGAALEELPELLHLCFSEPVKIEDPSDFRFAVVTPGGQPLGLRIVFRKTGDCVDVEPGTYTGKVKGDWTFQWQVTARDSGDIGAGTIRFTVTTEPSPSPSPAPVTASEADGGEGPDIAEMALITMGAILGAGAAGLVLYAVRQRIGFWLHRPPPREGSGGAEHH
ncbi:MAG: copper resistance protein CopC [Chloroflexi bacterium]|nr:copper resistance protein CopC [Chloroflexota bacterium]